ncbi:hypothetical protein ACPA9J_04045 [Pseudomonas aeruginosa]
MDCVRREREGGDVRHRDRRGLHRAPWAPIKLIGSSPEKMGRPRGARRSSPAGVARRRHFTAVQTPSVRWQVADRARRCCPPAPAALAARCGRPFGARRGPRLPV